MQFDQPFIDGEFFVFPDGRRLPRVRGAEGDAGDSGDGGAAGGNSGAGGPAGESAGQGGGGKTGDDEPKPPWGSDEDFDPKRAWKLITDLRDEAKRAKTERDEFKGKVQQHEDASKSDQQKLEERATGAEGRAQKAEAQVARLEVAIEKGLTLVQAKRLVGETKEDLEKDADELLASFKSDDGDGQEPRRRPKERLRPGAAPGAEPEETDPTKLAAAVPRRW